ncbi:MAG: hypothetical protein JW881_00305 [Spirochaetales bacterium]|nr:hypothetical protein [Spirochaetales bacterium]
MNLEFHYYIVYILSKEAGFSDGDSHIIAYSSQYTDNNLIGRRIRVNGSIYETIPTQNYGWWDDYYPKNVYIPFHFFPGDPEYPGCRRKDGKRNHLNTTPGSSRVKELLVAGLKTRNLYRVGIAVHTYADSWAHQNFSGADEAWNLVDPQSIIPHIGHAQVLGKPDGLTGRWTDARLEGDLAAVDNTDRFLKAAKQIYKYLRTYNHLSFEDHDVVIEKVKWVSGIESRLPSYMESRIYSYIIDENIQKYDKYEWYREAVFDDEVVLDDANGFVGYDKLLWAKDAFLHGTKTSGKPALTAKAGFQDSHYYRWNEAAKEHLATARQLLKGII